MLATRMRNTAFERVLKTLSLGAALTIRGPNGEMALKDSLPASVVFLADGIGVTPFCSTALHAAHARPPHCIVLICGNRTREDTAFLDEFEEIGQRNSKFRLVALLSEPGKSARTWNGDTGFIQHELSKREAPNPKAALYCFAGPTAMTEEMRYVGCYRY